MDRFINILVRKPIIDVVVSGFLDEGDSLVFHPMYDRLYFVFHEGIFELYLDEDGLINFKNIEKVKLWFDIDENDKFSQMSVYSQIFKTEQEITVSEVSYKKEPFSVMSITYHEGDIERTLILDPNNFFGFTFL